jgi:hypothetical protein
MLLPNTRRPLAGIGRIPDSCRRPGYRAVRPGGHVWPRDHNTSVEGLDASEVIGDFFDPTTS